MLTIPAEKREDLSKSSRNRLRRTGRVPGVVYGKKIGNQPIHVKETHLLQLFKQHGKNVLLQLDLGPDKPTVMVGEVQTDPITQQLLHIDFFEVDMDEEVTLSVPLEIVGQSAAEAKGGVLQKQHQELEIRCLPKDVPEVITLDVSGLDFGDQITVADLKLDEGIQVLAEPETVLVTVTAPTPEEGPVEDDGDMMEPPELVERREDAEE